MQLINQVMLAVFSLILLSIYSTTYHVKGLVGSSVVTRFWSNSILLRIIACVSWAIVPFTHLNVLLIANSAYIGSIILLVLYIRSWDHDTSERTKLSALAFWLAFSITFGTFLTFENSFVQRVWLTSIATMILSLWELSVVWRYTRHESSRLLRVLLAVVFLQVFITGTSLIVYIVRGIPNGQSILEANANTPAMLMLWITLGTHLMSYITINSFLYNKIWDSERAAHDQLKQQGEELRQTTHEKEEIKLLLEERESLINGLIRANKTAATGALAASIAHELGQPMAVIQMNAELLYKHAHTPEQIKAIDPTEYLHILGGILKSNHLAAGIIKTLRGIFSQAKPQFETVDLRQLVCSVVQLAKTEIDRLNVRLHVDIDADLKLQGYPNELFQVFLNLLNNALQALGGVSVTDRVIRITASREGNKICLTLSDNGPGIAPEDQAKLFQLFALGSKPESMGLGLWLCHYIVHRHNGQIRYEPSESGGANFLIELPVKQIQTGG